MFAASWKLTAWPSVQLWVVVAEVTFGAVFLTLTWNVSDPEYPLVSVAVTLIDRLDDASGAVPLKVSVAALKVSHDGKAEPFASVAA